jgi:hypothetical protein
VQCSAAKYEAQKSVVNSMSRREDNIKMGTEKKDQDFWGRFIWLSIWNSENVFEGSYKHFDSAEGSKFF